MRRTTCCLAVWCIALCAPKLDGLPGRFIIDRKEHDFPGRMTLGKDGPAAGRANARCAAAAMGGPGIEERRMARPDELTQAEIAATALRAVIADNSEIGEHRAGYNGVIRIEAPGLPESPFVPFYAGLNLEHYFDAQARHPDHRVFFEPRHAPMELRRVSDTAVELYQAPTPHYGVESWSRFEAVEPHAVDFAFRMIPRKPAFLGGFAGVFWASYINAPADKSIYFLGEGSTLDHPVWVQYCTQLHGRDSTVMHESDRFPYVFAGGPGTLFSSFSPLRYSEPFFYGRFRDHVLIFIFEPGKCVRFSHSPSGGGHTPRGDDTNPAWDFQLIVPDYEVGREYGLRARLVCKPWVDRADVLREAAAFLRRDTP